MSDFILRIDDCGWRPDKSDDLGLEYFRDWREAAGLEGLPVHYGFIPTTLDVRGMDWLRENLRGGEKIALHGATHRRGEEVTFELMRRYGRMLWWLVDSQMNSYIPPFNAYDRSTLQHWSRFVQDLEPWSPRIVGYFFGGFPDDAQSVSLGETPSVPSSWLIHLPATRELYNQATQLCAALPRAIDSDPGYPRVVTMHLTWDHEHFGAVREVVDLLRPHLRSVECARDWLGKHVGEI